MEYATLKALHVGAVALSYGSFFVRGVWMLSAPRMLAQRWVKITPHVIDTILLASAIALTVVIGQYPFRADWLTAKVIALIVYIVLGTLALKRAPSKNVRLGCWIVAQLVFCYIVAVALTHDPIPRFSR